MRVRERHWNFADTPATLAVLLTPVLDEPTATTRTSSRERRAPITAATFRKLITRAVEASGLGMPIHPHMLRHSTGFKLANDGQDTRGH